MVDELSKEEYEYEYTQKSDIFVEKIWVLFCESHSLFPPPKPEIVGNHRNFKGEALLLWRTDFCDILKDSRDGHLIVRKKLRMFRL